MLRSWWGARLVNSVLDAFYDRMDLWRCKDAREADYAKVRGLVMYCVVAFVMVYTTVYGKTIPASFLISVSIAMLALAAGERAFMAFLKAWGNKVGDMEGTVEFVPHEWSSGPPDDGVI